MSAGLLVEVHPEFLKALGVVGLSLIEMPLQHPYDIDDVSPNWQTGVVVLLCTKGNLKVCLNYRGISLLSLLRRSISGCWRREFNQW